MRGSTPRSPTMNISASVIDALLQEGHTYKQIRSVVSCSNSTISYRARRLGLQRPTSKYDWAAIQRFYNEGHNVKECMAQFGFSRAAWKDARNKGKIINKPQLIPLHEVLVDGRRTNSVQLKQRLIAAKLLEERCLWCRISEWRGVKLVLQLDHINGDSADNRLGNLRLLCPNCHSQTDTYCGKNVKNGGG